MLAEICTLPVTAGKFYRVKAMVMVLGGNATDYMGVFTDGGVGADGWIYERNSTTNIVGTMNQAFSAGIVGAMVVFEGLFAAAQTGFARFKYGSTAAAGVRKIRAGSFFEIEELN